MLQFFINIVFIRFVLVEKLNTFNGVLLYLFRQIKCAKIIKLNSLNIRKIINTLSCQIYLKLKCTITFLVNLF